MAERRRRKLANNIDSDEGSEGESDEEKKPSKSGSDVGDSEYESADEEELGDEDEELILIRDSDGLGEDNKQLDDDEDRKNPQYIPKKGTFYEHDDRTAADADLESSKDSEEIRIDAEVTAKKDLITNKKKVWKEDDKWCHDKFVDYEQSPKTREELITIYGYDIRNEEGPPRARRRRRYGRGPNKYTRNWEDLDAYSKPSRGSPILRGGGRGVLKGNRRVPENTEEEFPALGSHHQHISDGDNERIQNEKYVHKAERDPSHQYEHHSSNDHLEGQHKDHTKIHTGEGRGRGRARGRGGSGGRGGQYKDSNRMNESSGVGRGGGGNYGSGQQYRGPHVSAREQLQEISAELRNISISSNNTQQQQQPPPRDDQPQQHHHHQHHRGRGRGGGGGGGGRSSVPPRMQDNSSSNAGSNRGVSNSSGDGNSGEGNGGSSRPKRYSSQRQRSISDQPGSPYQGQHQGYIEQGLDQGYGGFEGGNNSNRSNSSLGAQQQHLGSGSGGSFVPPAYTSGNNFPTEPFLARPPGPRMFTSQAGPGPHMIAPGVAGSPVGVGGGAPRVVGPPGVGGVGGPPGVAGPPVGVPTVGGPPVTGPPFLPAENMISYVGPPPPPPPHPGPPHLGPHPATAPFAGPPPPQFPPFQGYPPGPTSQPQEIYSNGVTYYNTQNQQVAPRVIQPLQKRPKAAIPIVPPPDSNSLNSSSNNLDTVAIPAVPDGSSSPAESQELRLSEQNQEMAKEDSNSPCNQIKNEVNGLEHEREQITSTDEIKICEGQESSMEKKEDKKNILDTENAKLGQKIIDNIEVMKSDTKEVIIEEKDVNHEVELSVEKLNDDGKCVVESGEAAVLVDSTPIAAS